MAQLQQRVPAPATAGIVALVVGAALASVESLAQPLASQPPASQPQASQAPAAGPPAAAGPPRRKPLDLRAPDVRRIVSAAALREPLPTDGDEVTIESRRAPVPDPATPAVPGGIAAPFWAIRHPTQAWRILAPVPNARAAQRPDPVPKRTP